MPPNLSYYGTNTKLTSNEYTLFLLKWMNSCAIAKWTFKFRKVVQQQILGEVIDFTPAFSAVHLKMRQWKIIKIGPQLPKLL